MSFGGCCCFLVPCTTNQLLLHKTSIYCLLLLSACVYVCVCLQKVVVGRENPLNCWANSIRTTLLLALIALWLVSIAATFIETTAAAIAAIPTSHKRKNKRIQPLRPKKTNPTNKEVMGQGRATTPLSSPHHHENWSSRRGTWCWYAPNWLISGDAVSWNNNNNNNRSRGTTTTTMMKSQPDPYCLGPTLMPTISCIRTPIPKSHAYRADGTLIPAFRCFFTS